MFKEKKMEWTDFIKKRVFIKLTNGYMYKGEVLEVDDRNPVCVFITILDKYNEVVTVANTEIAIIREER